MKENEKTIWFPKKAQGIGWGLPVVWQGWAVLLSYILLIVIGGIALINSDSTRPLFYIYAVVLTVLLIFVCWMKGEKSE